MEWKKVKWVIIALLLAVNVFLAANIVYRYTEAVNHEKDALRAALELSRDTAGFEEDMFSSLPRYLYEYSGRRNTDMEERLADSLIEKEMSSSEAGGGVYIYASESERIVFRRGGALTGITGSKAGENADLGSVFENSGVSMSNSGGKLSFYYRKTLISNGALNISLLGDYISLSGRLPMCSQWQRTQKSRSRGEMVIALRDAVKENEMGEVISVQAVYYLDSDGGMGLVLIPAWKAVCEKGSITVSAMDKSVLLTDLFKGEE